MAAESPFGASFGDPRKYMGQSPLAQIGQAAKTGLMLYGLQKSGAIQALDNLGIKADSKGGFSFNTPTGSVPPITSGSTGVNADGVWGPNPMQATPMTFQQPIPPSSPAPSANGVQVNPLGADSPSNVQLNTLPPPPPANAGQQILDNTFRPQSAVELKNETDFQPLSPDTSNQMAVSGDNYKNVHGYGKLQKISKLFFG